MIVRKILPVLFAAMIFSCSKPAATENTADADADTTSLENGNTDGDYFVPGDSTEAEMEEAIDEKIGTREPIIDVCGFSDDGKYFAFTQVVPGDAANGTASVFVIDVAKNEWASKPAFADEVYVDLDSALKAKRDSMIVKYKIRNHQNIGKEINLKDKHTITINGASYEVDLKVNNLLIDLHVKGNGKDITLQKDRSLPKSRGSVKEYRLNKAFVSGDKIAVFVEYDGEVFEGFEGYRYFDRKNIAVTGVIK